MIVPVQFGGGLQRDQGILGYGDLSRVRDVRNVYLRGTKVEVRKGHLTKSTISGVDHILAVVSYRRERIGLVVTYTESSRAVDIYRVDGFGGSPTHLDTWFTLHASAQEPPRVIAADAGRYVFFAHDEVRVAYRGQTAYYDPEAASPLTLLTGELPTAGTEVKFRGVAHHLEYLNGWGFGLDAQDAPEVVRQSLPGQETAFEEYNYVSAGTRGDPVVSCLPIGTGTGARLLIFKGSETHELFGYDSSTFGVRMVDPLFGLASSRLAVNVSGVVFGWSNEGPRMWQGGGSEDLELPLELDAPAPSDLAAEGELEEGFAVWVPGRRCVDFHFGARTYRLHLWRRDSLEWSYEEKGLTAFCGGLLYTGGTAYSSPPEGYPTYNSTANITDTSADITFDLTDPAGDEYLEVWLRGDDPGDEWFLAESDAVVVGAQQTVSVGVDPALEGGTTYGVAARFRRGAYYTDGYSSNDPGTWPSYQADAFTTTTTGLVATAVWSRNSSTQEQVELTITPLVTDQDIVVERAEDDGAGYGAYSTIETILAADIDGSDEIVTDLSDDEGLSDPNAEWGERWHKYRITQNTAQIEVEVWTGPPAPAGVTVDDYNETYGDWEWYRYRVYTDGGTPELRVYDDWLCANSFELRHNEDPDDGDSGWLQLDKNSTKLETQDPSEEGVGSYKVRVYHRLTSFTVEDWSPYVQRFATARVADDETANNSCPGGGGGGSSPGDDGAPERQA